jgi:hypothetical protein
VVGAALSPGNVSFEAKWADWLRAHHAGLLAQRFEELYYSAIAPSKGGQPKALNRIPVTVGGAPVTADPQPGGGTSTASGMSATGGTAAAATPTTTTLPTTTTTIPPGLPPPSPVPLVVHPALAGEGKWQATGPALTARSLAASLQRAGAVRAMTLDINPEWVTFNFYSHQPEHPSAVTGAKLYPEMQR